MKYYFDYAATTPIDKKVLKAMEPYFSEKFGNTASLHSFGREAFLKLEECRVILAKIIKAKPVEIIFTSSATESNNLAIKGVAYANRSRGKHIIVSAIEHDCVFNAARSLESDGFKIDILLVDKNGIVDIKKLEELLTPETVLVSIIHGNNEIGVLQDIEKIGKLCHKYGALFHTDAAQSFTKEKIDVSKGNIDLLTASSQKIYGPKGAGFLYIKQGVQVRPLLHGGGQENNLRSSTVNLPAIVGFAKAAESKIDYSKIKNLRDYAINEILKIPNSYLNGHRIKRLANNINIRFDFIESESLLMLLDSEGIAVSAGSACSSPKLEPSRVLLSCGLSHEQAHGSIRISLGKDTKKKDVDYLVKHLKRSVIKLRKISPLS